MNERNTTRDCILRKYDTKSSVHSIAFIAVELAGKSS